MQRDNIDFKNEKISSLFSKIFIPTILGMLLSSTINVVDGIFVGKGVGADALAAVNIVAPFFMLSTGLSLMFASGVSVVAAIHLSKGKSKAANINITQAFTVSFLFIALICVAVLLKPTSFARLLGCSDRIMPLFLEYLYFIIPSLPFLAALMIGMFVIRLDGSPTFAMLCEAVPAVLNIILDYIFVFPLQMGVGGAAFASAIAQVVGFIMVIVYMTGFAKSVHFYKPKFSTTAIKLTIRNIGYMVRLGLSSMISEVAISCIMITGNFIFMKYLHEEGVAAFSVACYCMPLAFMIANAIGQSAQPIISSNYAVGLNKRVHQTAKLAMLIALVFGFLITLLCIVFSKQIIGLFLSPNDEAYNIAIKGFPIYAVSFLFMALNITEINYFQSVENFKKAIIYMSLRGFFFVIPAFILLPMAFGVSGVWSSVPLSEILTFIVISICTLYSYKRRTNSIN